MYRRIVVALDGSRRAEAVFGALGALLTLEDVKLFLTGVVDPDKLEGGPNAMAAHGAAKKAGLEYLTDAQAYVEGAGVRATAVLREGATALELLSVSRDRSCDLIALATHGHGGLTRLVMGSVAQAILRARESAVLVVRSAHWREANRPLLARRRLADILVPLDGSAMAEVALVDALELAIAHQARLHLFHVTDDPDDPRIDGWLEPTADRLRARGVEVLPMLGQGAPAVAIADYAERAVVDMVVMTTHGKTGLKRVLLGSVAESLIARLDIPILLPLSA